MNTKQQVLDLIKKVDEIIESKRSSVTLTFFDGTESKAIISKMNMNNSISDDTFISELTIFTNDIDKKTTYDMFHIKDII